MTMVSKQRKRNLENYVRAVTENPPGQINQNGQLVSLHPGTSKPWECCLCSDQLATNRLYEKHVRDKHNVHKFLYFCECGYSNESAKGTGSHKRYCNGEAPVEHQLEFKCQLCKFSSQTENGVLVHKSVAHKEEYNDELTAKEKNLKWTEQEFEYLAKIIYELKKAKTKNINRVAGERLERSEGAVQKIRTKTEYKQVERRVKELLLEKDQQEERDRIAEEELTERVESMAQEFSEQELTVEVQELTDRQGSTEGESGIPLVGRIQTPEMADTIRRGEEVDFEIMNGSNRTGEDNSSRVDEQRRQDMVTLRRPIGRYFDIPLETPTDNIRRQLPVVPPTPFNESEMLSQLLMNQEDLIIVNTPTERRRLPETPLQWKNRERIRSSQTPVPQVQVRNAATMANQFQPVVNREITNQVLANNRRLMALRQGRNPNTTESDTPRGRRLPRQARRITTGNTILTDAEGNPEYKRTAYLDAHSYCQTLTDDTPLDCALKSYLSGDGNWESVTKEIASEVNKTKVPRKRKGPWMSNRRENRNTRKARIYQFTQKAYEQNRKATVHKILAGTSSLNNTEQVYPEIAEVEKTYIERLENGNKVDQTKVEFPPIEHKDNYGKFTEEEVQVVLKELKRNTAAGLDGIRTPDLKQIPTGHITAIMNYWWGWRLPEKSEECRTTLLPKKDHELHKVGNWRPITVGNLLTRVCAKLWDKRLRANIKLDQRQKGFVPVNGCYENVKILQNIVKQRKKSRKEYNLVFIDLAKAFDTVSHASIVKGLKRKGVPEPVIGTIQQMYKKATTTLTVGGKSTRKIEINSGVKQGCPLSPLLFNLIIDELIEKLKKTNIGVEIGGERICCMAFADDLVLISENKTHMKILIEESKEFFDMKGLQANAGKCASL